jgi:hypothetical protein
VAGERVPGLRLLTAVERSGRIAVEGRVASTLFFSLRGATDDATLVLFDDRRAATGGAAALLDALVGVPMIPERLMAVLSGCVSTSPPVTAESVGRYVRIRTADSRLYLEERAGRWRIRAGVFDELAAEYDYREGPWPSRVGLRTEPGRTPVIQLTLILEVADTRPRDPSVFAPRVPDGFERVTAAWVRDNGPLRR